MTPAQALRDRIVGYVDASGFDAHGVHVLSDNDTAEHRWSPDARIDIQSVSKGVCVLAAGIAAAEGLIEWDRPAHEYLALTDVGNGVGQVTLRHLLSMSSGVDFPWSATMMQDWPDVAVEFLRRDSSGRAFQYSNASTYTAMTAVAAQVGDIVDYLIPRLFTPLGIDDVDWDRCPNGRVLAGGGLRLRTEEMARIGKLIRDGGRWEGEQLVPASAIDAMHSHWVDAGDTPTYDRYALSGWAGPGHAWRLHGAYGQLIIFAGAAVVTITANDHFGADAAAAFIVDAIRE